MIKHSVAAGTGLGAAGLMHVLEQVPGVVSALGQIVVAVVGVFPAIKLLFKKKPKVKNDDK